MNNKIIILWGFIIVSLVCGIYFIGVKYQSEIKYVSLKNELKEATKKYIDEHNSKLPLNITTEELEELGYIKELKLDNKVCAADIKADKKILFHKFDIKFTCVNTEEDKLSD